MYACVRIYVRTFSLSPIAITRKLTMKLCYIYNLIDVNYYL